MARDSYFELPNDPEQFGLPLPPPDLRAINYTALEWHPLVRAYIEYIKTYYPDTFNNFVAHTGVMMLAELMAYGAANAALHGDVLVNEAFLPSATTRDAVAQHLKLIDRPLKRQTPAVVDVSVRIPNPVPSSIKIAAGEKFTIAGPDGTAVTYEMYRAPGDFSSDIEILPNRNGVIAIGIEGQFQSPIVVTSDGSKTQRVAIRNSRVLDEPIYVDVSTVSGDSTVRWRRISAIERAGPNDEVYEVRFYDGGCQIIFGDDVTGRAPVAGQQISVRYRVGGGVRGRIPAMVINETRQVPLTTTPGFVEVTFQNLEASSGGMDEESIEVAKRVAPKEAATLKSATTGEDYAVLAKNFSHPVFGSILKAVATNRSDLNANLVELYVLAEGPSGDPVSPSEGLKRGIASFFEDIMVLTDEMRVYSAELLPVDLEMQVVVSRSADHSIVITEVEQTIADLFDPKTRDLGEGLYKAQIYEAVQKIDGVRFVSIHKPDDNIYPVDKDSSISESVVKFNQLIVLGQKKVEYFSER